MPNTTVNPEAIRARGVRRVITRDSLGSESRGGGLMILRYSRKCCGIGAQHRAEPLVVAGHDQIPPVWAEPCNLSCPLMANQRHDANYCVRGSLQGQLSRWARGST
jgi:hypothetical protein